MLMHVLKKGVIMLTYKNILYVYSDSVDNQQGLEKAVKLAVASNAKLTVLFTLSNDTLPESLGFHQAEINNFISQKEYERDQVLLALSHDISIEKETILSNSYLDVIEKIKLLNIDLVIKPSENEGLLSKLFGSNDMGFLRQCPCPVWLVNAEDKAHSNIVIAAVDVSTNHPDKEIEIRHQLNMAVVKSAVSLAQAKGASVHLVSVWAAKYEHTLRHSAFLSKSQADVESYISDAKALHERNFSLLMADIEQAIEQKLLTSVNLQQVSIKGNPREALPNYAKEVNADLVVMGTVARVGIPGLLIGNTAENILYRLNQSVLALKPYGF